MSSKSFILLSESIVLILIQATTINMMKGAYLCALLQFMVCCIFVTIFDFVDLSGQPGPFGWNVIVVIFKLDFVLIAIPG
jgi:hypothetical protein